MPDALAVVVPVVVVGWAYARGLRRLWARAGAGRVTRHWEAACFGAGLVALLAVLLPPFEHVAGERLWAHMVQHVTLVAVVAPLLVLGNPMGTLPWALPAVWRRRVSSGGGRLSLGHASHYPALAALALGVHTAALWVWHVPGPYEAALRSEPLHALEHASLFGTALFFWWVVAGSRRRALYGPGVLVTFAAALQGSALGALMTLATSPWYPSYVDGTAGAGAAVGLTPLEDQQVAGVVMWGPCGAVYALAAVLLFAAWIRRPEGGGWAAEETSRRPEGTRSPRPVAAAKSGE